MNQYSQSTGRWILDNGHVLGVGYSGHGPGKNDSSYQACPNIGPIPVGTYTIGQEYTHPEKGPIVMRLTPDPKNQMFGRSGFLIHGDSIKMPGTASEGCLVFDHNSREIIAGLKDRLLKVVS